MDKSFYRFKGLEGDASKSLGPDVGDKNQECLFFHDNLEIATLSVN